MRVVDRGAPVVGWGSVALRVDSACVSVEEYFREM